ncbi:hypothetical protein L6452_33104 [Arctium lappa]|uniref:Uncharacterized protein n=1 Tax=Arctium lappa TaxID=4217 RepID=A0ACB8Z713_ARCLA|nr:hypothetical protein L6452_33104 [Arctium lappa]
MVAERNNKELGKIATIFFFTNFPVEWREKELWNFFSKHGSVVDVYIARKLNKERRKFGFVRFIKVTDVSAFERRLRRLWIGNHKLFLSMEKFKRKSLKRGVLAAPKANDERYVGIRSGKGFRSYADALTRKGEPGNKEDRD